MKSTRACYIESSTSPSPPPASPLSPPPDRLPTPHIQPSVTTSPRTYHAKTPTPRTRSISPPHIPLTASTSPAPPRETAKPAITAPLPPADPSASTAAEIQQLTEERDRLRAQLGLGVDPELVVQRHIAQLGVYNEIRDVAEGLMAIIAEEKGVRLGEVMEGFGLVGGGGASGREGREGRRKV